MKRQFETQRNLFRCDLEARDENILWETINYFNQHALNVEKKLTKPQIRRDS